MFKFLIKPTKRLKPEEEIPIELIQRADMIDKILQIHKSNTE